MSNEMLEKVVSTSTIGAGDGGILNAEQQDTFLDYIWDETVLGKQVRKIRMNAPVMEIDKVSIGERIVRGATEAVDTGENAGATFTKISLTTKKLRLDWEISTESLEDNIEGENLDDHLARMFAQQFANDLEDLAVNGDTTSTDPLLKQFDGYSKLLKGSEGHVLDAEGSVLSRGVLNAAIKELPRKYLQRRGDFRFFTSTEAIQDYIYSLQAVEQGMVNPDTLAAAGVNQAVKPEGGAGYLSGNAFGLQIQEVIAIKGDADSAGELWLTSPQNLLWGIRRDVTVYREFAPKKDTLEYTVFVRCGVQVQHADASVVVENLGVADSTLVAPTP